MLNCRKWKLIAEKVLNKFLARPGGSPSFKLSPAWAPGPVCPSTSFPLSLIPQQPAWCWAHRKDPVMPLFLIVTFMLPWKEWIFNGPPILRQDCDRIFVCFFLCQKYWNTKLQAKGITWEHCLPLFLWFSLSPTETYLCCLDLFLL